MRFTLVIVNMLDYEDHPDITFPNMDDLETYVNAGYPGWTSLVVTILP